MLAMLFNNFLAEELQAVLSQNYELRLIFYKKIKLIIYCEFEKFSKELPNSELLPSKAFLNNCFLIRLERYR